VTQPADRGRVVPPDLDDRTWQDLVDEMRALIPKYAPQWTDHNPSDLGITLIELFAWLGEGIIYRLNRTPEKNFLAFLNLLGTTRDPATPASTYLTFTSGAGAVTVPAGTKAQTAATQDQQPIVFETDEDVTVLPISLANAVVVGPPPRSQPHPHSRGSSAAGTGTADRTRRPSSVARRRAVRAVTARTALHRGRGPRGRRSIRDEQNHRRHPR